MFEERYIFHPSRVLEGDPGDWGLEYEDVRFGADDLPRLHGWLVPGRKEITWIWFHGNAGNISHRLDSIRLFHDELGVGIFIFDYRGYGASEGRPTERGLYRDAEAAIQWVRSHPVAGAHQLLFFGRSLGTAVAVEMARRHRPWGLILEAPLLSIRAMAADHGLWAVAMASLLFRARLDSLRKIKDIHAPLLVIHGQQDETIPFRHGQRLFEAANDPKQLYAIPNGGHTDGHVAGGGEYIATLERFMAGLGPQLP